MEGRGEKAEGFHRCLVGGVVGIHGRSVTHGTPGHQSVGERESAKGHLNPGYDPLWIEVRGLRGLSTQKLSHSAAGVDAVALWRKVLVAH
jgi:hypothetical protein